MHVKTILKCITWQKHVNTILIKFYLINKTFSFYVLIIFSHWVSDTWPHYSVWFSIRLLLEKNVSFYKHLILYIFMLKKTVSYLFIPQDLMHLSGLWSSWNSYSEVEILYFVYITCDVWLFCVVFNFFMSNLQIVYGLIVYMERKNSIRSSGLLFNFWFLMFLISIITFRSKIRVAVQKVGWVIHVFFLFTVKYKSFITISEI